MSTSVFIGICVILVIAGVYVYLNRDDKKRPPAQPKEPKGERPPVDPDDRR